MGGGGEGGEERRGEERRGEESSEPVQKPRHLIHVSSEQKHQPVVTSTFILFTPALIGGENGLFLGEHHPSPARRTGLTAGPIDRYLWGGCELPPDTRTEMLFV
ncbi:unnamed protein product [Pleuronectes platessa]|uniref:Uncharacterized protein n=1 Tax=Pleuronectes platessa TaxID=8262 RepID=A0A9N7YNC3_PLEPL|nr:unnamed protein product [Pleuronectes platessa]